jgi:hypothetical protein
MSKTKKILLILLIIFTLPFSLFVVIPMQISYAITLNKWGKILKRRLAHVNEVDAIISDMKRIWWIPITLSIGEIVKSFTMQWSILKK